MTGDPAARARAAQVAGRWDEAVEAFQEVVRADDDPAAWNGLAVAARWSGDLGLAVEAREHAYRLFRDSGQDESAAGMAALLALDVAESSGASAVAAGWLGRARNLLLDLPGSRWNGVVDGIDGAVAGVYRREFARAQTLLESASAAARAGGDVDSELLATAQLGLVLVLSGEVERGLGLLDGAASGAVAGDVKQPGSAVAVCCLMTAACLSIRDLARAAEWSAYAMKVAGDRGGGRLFDYPRTDRAALLAWRGECEDARDELRDVLDHARGWSRPVAMAHLNLADVERRRDRPVEAARHLDELEAGGAAGLRPMVLAQRSRLALEAGKAVEAAELAQACLRSVHDDDLVVRVEPLEVLARAAAVLGRSEEARRAAEALAQLADLIGTSAVKGSAWVAQAASAECAGEPDRAAECWQHAVDAFRAAGTPLEVMAAEGGLARCRDVMSLGRGEAELRTRSDLGITARELDVLQLVASGLSNQQIADRLVVSVRTVEQHLANLYPKLGVSGRTARAAATSFAYVHGLLARPR